MVEFGEQLRRAREGKGMTQQSLAEQLYVTRQSVSRWECGDRYPDLLTTKKISQILDVSLDDLLAGKDMVKLVERNPVIEKKSANYIMIALYAFIVFSFLITIIDMIIRFPLQSQAVGYSDIQLIVINILGIIIQIVFFTYGLYQAVKGTLSPKRMGVVIVAYFGAMCITGSENIIRYATWQLVCVGIALIIPSIIGAIASFCYFIRCKNDKIWSRLISVAAIWGIIRIVINNYQMIRYAEQYLSMNTTVRLEEKGFQVSTIETTGAGDTFCGCSLAYILEHDINNLTEDHLREMLIFANAGAALVTTKKGAICSMPERREIVDLIDVSRNAIHQF